MYSPQVLDHFEHPRNSGSVAGADASVQLQNPACGDVLKLTLKAGEGSIGEIRFLAQGCVPSIACASALTELVRGKSIAEARSITREQLIESVGGLPPASSHAGQLAIDALNAALDQAEGKSDVASGSAWST